jgi:hypothetical protein
MVMINNSRFIELNAGVRYWEDANINGVEDTDGVIPLRQGDRWVPVIDLQTGEVAGWPEGLYASIHYKVCDDGEYWLLDEAHLRIAKWNDYYVPNDILCINDNGYGDYIIFQINQAGKIIDWKIPIIKEDDWDWLRK